MKNLSEIVQSSLYIAQATAGEFKHSQVTPLHLLWGLVENPQSETYSRYSNQKALIKAELDKLPTVKELSLSQIPLDNMLQEWLLSSSASATKKNEEVTEEHLFKFAEKYLPILKKMTVSTEENSSATKVPSFLINLNDLARDGKLDPVIGRKKEIRSMIEILGRRSKNNPILVGPAGVGKTAVVEGLAEAIVRGEVPPVLKDKTIYTLDLGALTAGTKFRGDFEERIQTLLKFVKEKKGEMILFIDEIHQLIGAGRTDGAMDAANLLKPALARGDLACIGATTSDEYQKYIQNDAALERRFRQVPIDEPSAEDTIEILMGLKDKFEIHHGIKISNDAIVKAVFLSKQYITDKQLPDKAIDLIDEASSSLRLSAQSMPIELVTLEKELKSKKIQAHYNKDDVLLNEIAVLEKKFNKEKEQWEKNTSNLKILQTYKDELNKKKFQAEQAESGQDYEQASRLKYSEIPQLEKKITEIDEDWVLTAKNIAQIISQQKQIPLDKILQSKQENILKLEEYLQNHIYGQTASLKTIANHLIPSFAGLTFGKKVLGSFLLAGPSGVGKTQTAKALAKYLFDDEDSLIRFDLSEYSEKHSVAKLIGAPAGYIGYDSGGILTEAIKRHPYSVVLFDEVEKAHPDFLDILLQVLDAGRLTDNKGKVVDFKNTIIILTTNATDFNIFKRELLGRLDAVCQYLPLSKDSFNLIIDEFMKELSSSEIFKDKGVNFSLAQEARDYIMGMSNSELYGARLLKSVLQQEIVVPIAKKILDGSIKDISNKEFMINLGEKGIELKIKDKDS